MGIPKIEENKYYTLEEYLAFEEVAEEKHEYHNGIIISMAGGTGKHSVISNRIGTAIDIQIDKANKDCTTFNSDMKVEIDKYDKVVYPDASVVCGDIEYTNENETVLTNPILLIEVLSKSTKKYDKGEKFEMYRSIPSFKEYMIVYQTIPKVQTWYKEDKDLWRIGNAEGINESIKLHSIGITVALKDIYKRVKDLKEVPQDLSDVW